MHLLKYIKAVLRFGLCCQYLVAVTRTSVNFCLPFSRFTGANTETNSKDARAALEAIKLDEDELVVSLDVKSLYTNVPVEEEIEIALEELYSIDEIPEIPSSAMKSLLRLAVTNIHFKCNEMWYTQSDGLEMGASLAVILANLWIKSFKKPLQKPNEGRENKTPDTKVTCIDCNRRVTFRGKGVDCESCKTGFIQNAKMSLTQSIRPCRTLFGFVPIGRKKVQKRTRRN